MTATIPKIEPSMQSLANINDLAGALSRLHYKILARNPDENSITTTMQVGGRDYPVLIDINDDNTAVRIECQLAKFGDVCKDEAGMGAALLVLLSLNAQIVPFAVSIYQMKILAALPSFSG